MEKVNVFWDTLCLKFKYNFFTGIPFKEFMLLFNTMKSDFLHYIPAVNEVTALGVATGYSLSGQKSVLLLKAAGFDLIKQQFERFNIDYNIPILILTNSDYNPIGLKQYKLSEGLDNIEIVDKHVVNNESVILIIEDGDLIK